MEKSIVLGGGCFWCLEAVFQRLNGVKGVRSGYAGDVAEKATYELVCSGTTRHVEVVELIYDSTVLSLEEILEVFWTVHDPTTPDQQGNDRGPQYRSAIFFTSDEERLIAQKSIDELASKLYNDPVVTELALLEAFFPAEEYHHNYYNRIGNRNPYCTFVVNPKVQKFKKHFAHKMKTSD